MALIVISVDRSSLPSHTDDQFEEWVEFNVGHRGGLSEDNPLADIDMEAIQEIVELSSYGNQSNRSDHVPM